MPMRAKTAGVDVVCAPRDLAKLGPHSVRDGTYAQALHRHLSDIGAKEIDFFVNPRRVAMIESLIGHVLRNPGVRILNVACGPFAIEYYLGLARARITSFDREARLAPLHKELAGRGLIAHSEFRVADVEKFETAERFDIVLINDLFYSKYVDFYALIGRYIEFVAPGGLIYFDLQDERAGPIWRAFGKDANYRRYKLSDVARTLNKAGLEIAAVEPALGIKGGLDSVLRKGLWRTARIANSYVFVARKPE